eukprot:TRINITY_DN3617_c0_g1_i1.p1 TRINITY_DN3617_c0_g1~~TRINITY_DN3617_c0_g1_i1.p1  ORF type:complete len:848 (+),score=148.54 TRINITY_DN3617_c0_g1_i1:13-2556(+)
MEVVSDTQMDMDVPWGRCRFSEKEVQEYWKKFERPTGPTQASLDYELEESGVSKKRDTKTKGLAPFSGKRGVARRKTKSGSSQTAIISSQNNLQSISEAPVKKVALEDQADWNLLLDSTDFGAEVEVVEPLVFHNLLNMKPPQKKTKASQKIMTAATNYVGYLGRTLMDLPEDLLLLIMKSLDFPSFVSTLTLTKRWFQVSKNDFLSIHFFLGAQEQLAKDYKLDDSLWRDLEVPYEEMLSKHPLLETYLIDSISGDTQSGSESRGFAGASESDESLGKRRHSVRMRKGHSTGRSRYKSGERPSSAARSSSPKRRSSSRTQLSATVSQDVEKHESGKDSSSEGGASGEGEDARYSNKRFNPGNEIIEEKLSAEEADPNGADSVASEDQQSEVANEKKEDKDEKPEAKTEDTTAKSNINFDPPTEAKAEAPDVTTDFTEASSPSPMIRVDDSSVSSNKLIGALTDTPKNNSELMDCQCFTSMHPCWTSTQLVILKLMQRYFTPLPTTYPPQTKGQFNKLERTPIRSLVISLFSLIINDYYPTLKPLERICCVTFARLLESKREQLPLMASIKRGKRVLNEGPPPMASSWLSLKGPPPTDAMSRQLDDIFDLQPIEIAKRLCVLEFEIFKDVKPSEFHKEAWAKRPENAQNIRGMIDRFNAITRWIVHCIVTQNKIRNRVKRYRFFIRVAEQLYKCNNFHTMMAVLSGINEGPVHRLNHTKEEVGAKDRAVYDHLQSIMAAEKSYALYRVDLQKAFVNPPGIPYIGVYLRDCTYFGDGLYENGLVNCKKVQGIWGIVQQVQRFQQHPYTFEANDKLDSILGPLSSLPMNDLLAISRQVEPKNAARADIQ